MRKTEKMEVLRAASRPAAPSAALEIVREAFDGLTITATPSDFGAQQMSRT